MSQSAEYRDRVTTLSRYFKYCRIFGVRARKKIALVYSPWLDLDMHLFMTTKDGIVLILDDREVLCCTEKINKDWKFKSQHVAWYLSQVKYFYIFAPKSKFKKLLKKKCTFNLLPKNATSVR